MFRIASAMLLCLLPHAAHAIGFANGMKMGEVNDRSVVVWTRLTAKPEPINPVADWTKDQPNWVVPGLDGEVRIRLTTVEGGKESKQSGWQTVGAQTDHCLQIRFDALEPATRYDVQIEGRTAADSGEVASLTGSFTTAPVVTSDKPVFFTVSTCQEFEQRDDKQNGHRIYHSMLAEKPQFFLQTGDTVYYDRVEPLSTNIGLARYRWQRMYALPFQREFHRHIPTYWMHDDHDLLKNDCWPGQSYGDLTWDQGVQVWNEQIPQSPLPYRTFRWGRDVQIWLPEGRLFRSPNPMPDGPEKTILGKEQWKWLEQSLAASDATFKFYVSATPVVGPDRKEKNDNHANEGFAYEGEKLRKLLHGTPGLVVINGDRHWQYHSVDPVTGLNEFGCGPASDSHAGGFSEKNREASQRFLRIKGGYVSVRVDGGKAELAHHTVDGEVVYRVTIERPQ